MSECNQQIDWSKPVEHVDGRKARVLTMNRRHHSSPIVLAVMAKDDRYEYIDTATLDGRTCRGGKIQFRNVPERVTVWVNFYPKTGGAAAHSSREEATKRRRDGCDACVEVTYTVGEGLE